MVNSWKCRQQRGVTIPEMSVAVLVAAVLGAAATTGLGYAIRDNTAINVATQIANGYDTLNNYVATNVDAIINGTPVPGVTNALSPTVAELRNLGYRSFSTQSAIGSITYAYSLALTPAGCTPNTCNVAVYYGMSTSPVGKDGRVDMAMATNIANRIGRPAGFSSLNAPGNIVGLGGSFNIANPTGPNPGIVAAYGSYGAGQFGNYVRLGDTRDIPLMGKLSVAGSVSTNGTVTAAGNIAAGNALSSVGPASIGGSVSVAGGTATIDSNGNLRTFGKIAASGAVEASDGIRAWNGKVWMAPAALTGWPCSDGTGTVTTDPNGQVLSCQAGVWLKAGSAQLVGTWVDSRVGHGWDPIMCPPGWVMVGAQVSMSDVWTAYCQQLQ